MGLAVFSDDWVINAFNRAFTIPPYLFPTMNLFSNNFTPTRATVLGDFVPCNFGNYFPAPASALSGYGYYFGVPGLPFGPYTFFQNGAPNDIAYGWFLQDDNGDLFCSGLFDAPINFGDDYVVLNFFIMLDFEQGFTNVLRMA